MARLIMVTVTCRGCGAAQSLPAGAKPDTCSCGYELRELVDRAAKLAVTADWDLSAFCDLAAKAFERHGGRLG